MEGNPSNRPIGSDAIPGGQLQQRPARVSKTTRQRKTLLAPATGFAAALLLTLVALAVSHSSAKLPGTLQFLLLLAPPAILIATGSLWPALFAVALCVAGSELTPIRQLGISGALDVLLIDLLAVGAIAGFQRAKQRTSENATLDNILQSILQADTSGIAVLTRSGRVLYASHEAERICGPELHAGRGLGAASAIKLVTADGRRLTPIDLIAGSDRDNAPPSNAAGTRDLMIVRADEERVWVEYRAMPVRAGAGRAAAIVLIFWGNRALHQTQTQGSYDDMLRKRREEREEMLQRISQQLRGSVDAHHIQTVAAEELGMALRADRCFFLQFNVREHHALMGPEWRSPGTPELVQIDTPVDLDVERLYRRSVTRISHDMRSSSLPGSVVSVFEDKLGVRSAINVPLYDGGQNATAALVVAMAEQPRAWSADEVAIAEMVASQTRFVSEAARLLAAERDRTEREQLSNRIGSTLRSTLDPFKIQQDATRELGAALEVDRCYYVQYDIDAHTAMVGPDYTKPGAVFVDETGVESEQALSTLSGIYALPSDNGEFEREIARMTDTVVQDDTVESELGALHASSLITLTTEPVRAFIRVPIITQGLPNAALIVAMAEEPRAWTHDEIALVESVASQTVSAISNAQTLVRERARAEREELLSRVTIAIGQAKTARDAQEEAARVLAERLGADRCYVIVMDYATDQAQITAEYRRPALNLDPVAGAYPLDDREIAWLSALVADGSPYVVGDLRREMRQHATLARGAFGLLARGHRSLMVVPQILGGRIESLLIVATADRPRNWTNEEAELAEEVAVRMRVALASAVTHERERNIARILQDALLPEVPVNLPGVTVATHYRAALVEASIGGDFYDAFQIGPTSTALCVGDVSGKGLVAAAQLSSLRNMLRATLYRDDTALAPAVSQLNAIIAQHRLLSGFATLFVGVYNSATRKLTYVSCGHEPAILLRSVGGKPRVLQPTGPALGVFEQADDEPFQAGTVTLGENDLILLYTDGVFEAGKSTRGMLGTAGIAQMIVESVAEQPEGSAPQTIMDEFVRRISDYADGMFRDDMCLLLARVSG